jgi:hypothetical protein
MGPNGRSVAMDSGSLSEKILKNKFIACGYLIVLSAAGRKRPLAKGFQVFIYLKGSRQ